MKLYNVWVFSNGSEKWACRASGLRMCDARRMADEIAAEIAAPVPRGHSMRRFGAVKVLDDSKCIDWATSEVRDYIPAGVMG